MPIAPRPSSPLGAVLVALVLMGVAALENGPLPWSPFYFLYASLAIGLPLAWKRYRFGPARALRWWQWPACLLLAVSAQAAVSALLQLSARLAPTTGGADGLTAMFGRLFAAAAARWQSTPEQMAAAYLGFILLWAGLGEELFYRGYLQGTLRQRLGAWPAILLAAFLFAIRHFVQMDLLWPDYPWAPATIWVAAALLVGILLGWLYERTGSLWMPVLTHYCFNLLPVLGGALGS